jgi:site-specific DNA recombinase
VDTNLIFGVYARVSDKAKQGDNFSISTQLQLQREGVEKQGWTVSYELPDYGSAWQNGLERSELNRALELARTGKIQALMFFSSDRFTRDIGDGVILRKQLREYGVRLFCYYPSMQEITSDLDIVWILTDYVSQKDAERRRESSMRGIKGKVDLGIYPQGLVPYGYILVGKHRDTHLEFNEMEAKAVVGIFYWYYYDNTGVTEIVRRLNESPYRPSQHNRKSGLWTARNVRNILKNGSYTGTWYAYTFKRVNGKKTRRPENEWVPIQIPQLVTSAVFAGVQEKLRTRHNGRVSENQYLMSNRIKCICGKPDSGQTVQNKGHYQRYSYYRCTSTHYATGFCGRKKFPAGAVDDIMWKFALELLTNPEMLIAGYRELAENQTIQEDKTRSLIAILDEQIAAQQEQLASIVDQRTTAKGKALQILLDQRAEEYSAVIDELQGRRDKLIEELDVDEIRPEEMVEEVEALRQMYTALYTIDTEADFAAKRYLIELLNLHAILRVEENGEMWVDIHWLANTHPKLLTQKTKSGRRSAQSIGYK